MLRQNIVNSAVPTITTAPHQSRRETFNACLVLTMYVNLPRPYLLLKLYGLRGNLERSSERHYINSGLPENSSAFTLQAFESCTPKQRNLWRAFESPEATILKRNTFAFSLQFLTCGIHDVKQKEKDSRVKMQCATPGKISAFEDCCLGSTRQLPQIERRQQGISSLSKHCYLFLFTWTARTLQPISSKKLA